jgi:hypothetical protein
MTYFGSRGTAAASQVWHDPVRPAAPFYLFGLPFYSELLGFLFTLAVLCVLVFWATARGWQLLERFAGGGRAADAVRSNSILTHCCFPAPPAPGSRASSRPSCCSVSPPDRTRQLRAAL